MIKRYTTAPELSQLEALMTFAENFLSSSGTVKKEKIKTLLLIEESFVQLVNASNGKSHITVIARKSGSIVRFSLKCAGSRIESSSIDEEKLEFEDMDASAEAVIRQMILNANSDNYKLAYRNGVNIVSIVAGHPTSSAMKRVLIALAIAIVMGLILRLLPPEISLAIDTYLLIPVKTLFMNALKMIVAPLVFFSIAASVSSFSDMRELGKTGGRVILFYSFTTLVAVLIGIVMFNVLDPGELGQFDFALSGSEAAEGFSIIDTITGIIPGNFIQAFYNSDTLQLIFLAFIFGIAASNMGKSSSKVAEFLSCGSDLAIAVAQIITSFIPLMIISSISHTILTAELQTMISVGEMIVCVIICNIIMIAVYSMLVLILARRNPLSFLRLAMPAWINALALSSSNAAMSYTMDVCDKNLKVSKSIYSFSIPLGSTINMDGLSILLSFSLLFFAKMCGMPLGMSDIIPLAFTVIVLSFGCPGIAGAGILCFSVLLEQFGLPMECCVLFAAVDSLLDPLSTANNVFGDIVGTYVIAVRSKLVKAE